MSLPKKEKIVSGEDVFTEDKYIDRKLRPKTLSEFIGQEKIKQSLLICLTAAKQRQEALDHILFNGGPGLGKTTLAYIIANELKTNIRITSGPALERAGDIAAILTALEEKDILFIDEIHRLNKTAQEILYPAMEEYAIDLVLGKGPSAKTIRLELNHFTLIGATTKPSLLPSPLRDRFGMTWSLNYYQTKEIEKILENSAKILGLKIERQALQEIAQRSRFTPRVANRLLKRVRDYNQVRNKDGFISKNIAKKALDLLGLDQIGLTDMDYKILETILNKFKGGPVGLKTLAISLGEEMSTLEEIYEPFLIQTGLLERTPRGRKITSKGLKHLGYQRGMF